MHTPDDSLLACRPRASRRTGRGGRGNDMADTRIRSGIPGLDNLIEGGFRDKTVVVVVGSSGTGKTTFTVQYILHGLEQGEQGLYVSLEESPEQIMREAELMGLDLRKHLEKDLFFIHLKGKNFKKMIEEQLPQLVKARADYQIKTRVVIDPMTPVIWATQDRLEQRELIGKLFYTLKELGVVLCTVEEHAKPGETIGEDVLLPVYLAGGAIHLEDPPLGGPHPPRVLPDRGRVQPHPQGPEDAGHPPRRGRVPVHLRPRRRGRRAVLPQLGAGRGDEVLAPEDVRRGVPDRGGAQGPALRPREDPQDERVVGLRLLPGGGPPDPLRLVRAQAVRPAMPTPAGKVDKTMEAENGGLRKHVLATGLKRVRQENGFDLVLFMGVDGRIFASDVPWTLDPRQYRLLNLVKGNLGHICGQLSGHKMMLSIQQDDVGTILIPGVGGKAFLTFLTTRPLEITQM